MGNGHTGWNGVGIDNEVGSEAFTGERHVFLPICDTDGTFLTVTRSKFISDLGNLCRSRTDFNESKTFGVGGEEDLIHNTIFSATERCRDVALCVHDRFVPKLLRIWGNGSSFANDNVVSGDTDTRCDNTIV